MAKKADVTESTMGSVSVEFEDDEGKPHSSEIHLNQMKKTRETVGPAFSCSICKTTFKLKTSLVLHTRTHSGVKPFSCFVCKVAFLTKYTLMQHMRTHTEEKLYSQNQKFAWGCQLPQHLSTSVQTKNEAEITATVQTDAVYDEHKDKRQEEQNYCPC